jgi:Tol biopolymer transport system component
MNRRTMWLLLSFAALGVAAPSAFGTSPGTEGRLAYTQVEAPASTRVMTVAPDGSDPRVLVDGASRAEWSGDGRTLAYCVDGDLRVAHADGSGARTVTPCSQPFAVSPDARTLVVQVLHGSGDHERWYLYRVSVATGKRTLVAKDAEQPAVSPDGRWVAFADRRAQGISRVRLDGTGKRVPIFRGHFVESLDWAPDGRSIAFIKFFRTKQLKYVDDLLVVNVRSGTRRLLVRRLAGPAGLSDPAWSPTGKRLVVGGWNSHRAVTDLLSVDAHSGAVTKLVEHGAAPAWQPGASGA